SGFSFRPPAADSAQNPTYYYVYGECPEAVSKVVRSVGSCVWLAKRVNRQLAKSVEQQAITK
ncbi:MAG: hypothetical protein KAX39_06825, partial [candidate division Zixibacteria bacterium]|nr:hypothetical protein [candidate division Zixibacteria bacterium]